MVLRGDPRVVLKSRGSQSILFVYLSVLFRISAILDTPGIPILNNSQNPFSLRVYHECIISCHTDLFPAGVNCELDVSVCNASEDGSKKCLNGGRCIEGIGATFSCECLDGTGEHLFLVEYPYTRYFSW